MSNAIEGLIEQVKQYDPKGNFDLIRLGYSYASKAHQGQKRKSGEDYIIHPLGVARILAELQLDVITITAGLLHDVVEDTEIELAEIKRVFGEEVALLVDGVTKLSRIEFKSKEEQQVENLRKMFLAMAKDIRVILIKLADRLHNMRTLKYQPPEKQKEIAEETVEIFAPLAHRLGIFKLKWELEDLALRYLEEEQYYQLVQTINMKRQEREDYINEVIGILQKHLEEMGIEADIQGRPKHFYSIYNKMTKQGKSINEIYDLIAVRVIVATVKDCYGVLGVIHSLWKPIPGRFKDYIAMPKPNMYQSLHTTVIGPKGEPFEIQIRTWEMHRTSEYGIAAHWRYKEGSPLADREFEDKLSWLRQLLEWQRDLRDAREFMDSLKIDLFSDRVYVFTPKGDVMELSAGSVPIDFAYRVHTDVGHRCVGAKVNGRIVPLDYKLNTGDIVEILTSKTGTPSRDWLNIVKTSQAKNRIRHWFKKEVREENVSKGRELLEKEAKKQGLTEEDYRTTYLAEVAKKFNLQGAEELFIAINDGVITVGQVIVKLREIAKRVEESNTGSSLTVSPWKGYGKPSKGVRIKGVDNVMVRLSRCCNPLPGDEIVGYVTRGRGVSIHRSDCPNICHYSAEDAGRIIEAAWDEQVEGKYQVQLEVVAIDRPGLAMDIMMAVADTKTVINAINARATKENFATVDLKLEIKGVEHLEYISNKIKRVKDVLETRRITPS
ncbi:MAG: bifunctional (p)ppGpp synthetase/guanosine-3',5'-bis(diphosphate) 3'-pyrophosphohydrolase [Clostridia bacterium]|nr:bifunctional (p)ppGpp synthetase/guanosine-3',5'-bis(diphosphate) 3'-pyrophosphohydrolase [Clostridia bacterium]